MHDYQLTVGIESTDRYKKARQDLVQAEKSFNLLTEEEKVCLIREMFAAEAVGLLYQAIKKCMDGDI